MSAAEQEVLARALSIFFRVQMYALAPLCLLSIYLALRPARKPIAPPAPHSVGTGDSLPRLAALQCTACGAGVPLATHGLTCPYCAAPIDPPEDYVQTIDLRARAAAGLLEAVRAWRRLRWWVSPPVTFVLLLVAIAWMPATLFGAAVGSPTDGSGKTVYGFIIGSLVAFSIFGLRSEAIDARRRLPVLPNGIGPSVGNAETLPCTVCGAPTRFDAGDLASMCGYCGAENYRVALARSARADAAKREHGAAVSVFNAMLEVRSRRAGMLTAALIAAVLSSWVIVIGWIASFFDAC